MNEEGKRLDPKDWAHFGEEFHALLDRCLTRMKGARTLPWQPNPPDLRDRVALDDVEKGMNADRLFKFLSEEIMPFATGNTHPKFFGWVHGTGLPLSVGADLVASTMNSNCGGRDHGAVEVERAVIDWVRRVSGLPKGASGILTTGTSQGTLLALSAARVKLFGEDFRETGLCGLPQLRLYASQGAHSCLSKALEIMGHGRQALCLVPTKGGHMDVEALQSLVREDKKQGLVPLGVVATAGFVNTGAFDPIDDIATFCEKEGVWFHIDGAFGFWAQLADQPWHALCKGMHRADSIACDFHKWMFVPYACGVCLIRDNVLHRATFANRPAYLETQNAGIGGGDLWYCDYGLDLSRGFAALKVWAAIKGCGTKAFGEVITDNCQQARFMGELVKETEGLRLASPVFSNICCIALDTGDANTLAAQIQLAGEAIFSTTRINGENCLRAAIVNHRTTHSDIVETIEVLAARLN